MVNLDIVETVDEPTGFVNGLAISEKPNGSICLDPRPPGQA